MEMGTLSFRLHNQLNREGKARIMGMYSHLGGRDKADPYIFRAQTESGIKLKVEPGAWILQRDFYENPRGYKRSESPERVKASHPEAEFINQALDQIERRIKLTVEKILLQGLEPTPARVRELFESRIHSPNLEGAFQGYLKVKKKELKYVTFGKYELVIRKLKALMKKKGMGFADIDQNFLKTYSEETGMQGNSLVLEASILKNFVKYLRMNGIAECKGVEFWETKKKKVDKLALNPDQLRKFIQFSDPGEWQEIRDWFVWLCLTGMRYGEAFKISKEYFSDGIQTYIKGKRRKGVVEYNALKIGPILMDILERNDFQLPRYKTYQLNRAFKELGKMLGIDEPFFDPQEGPIPSYQALMTSTGRNTFITLNRKRVDNPMKVTRAVGHSDMRITDIYDRDKNALGEKVSLEMEDWLLNEKGKD